MLQLMCDTWHMIGGGGEPSLKISASKLFCFGSYIQVTCDTWHVTPFYILMWHLTWDTWPMAHYMWHIVVNEYSLKISASLLLRFGSIDLLKIWRKRKRGSYWISYEGVSRTAPATQSLINTYINSNFVITYVKPRRPNFWSNYFAKKKIPHTGDTNSLNQCG